MRKFNDWLSTMRDSIATWKYYTDFDKVYRNVDTIKIELNILNSLIGSKNIEDDFKQILIDYPKTLKVIPILLAKREMEIKIKDAEKEYIFKFNKSNYTIDEYSKFMRNSGLFDLLENHIINNLVDYVMGVEVGMDTNGRKNRTGEAMEDLVESYLIKHGLVKNQTYFKEMTKTEIENRFNYDLSKISNNGKTEKRFDFVVKTDSKIYAIECNFYGSSGSKLNETARSYKMLAEESDKVVGFEFVWFTDGMGWISARNNLKETFDNMKNVYNIADMKNGIMREIFQ